MEDALMHYGTPRHSGRYPWGSGKNPQRNKNFLTHVKEMKAQGMSEVDIAKSCGMTVNQLRNAKSVALAEKKADDISRAKELHEKGYSNVKAAEMMGIPESTFRGYLKEDFAERNSKLGETADFLKQQVDEKKYIQVGSGVERELGISETKMKAALEKLKSEGYSVQNIYIDQLGTGFKTTVKILAPPGTEVKDIMRNLGDVQTITDYEAEGNATGMTKLGIRPPESLSSKRLQVVYAEEGGLDKDGVVELRRGVDDISLGKSSYAQVRIAVDGTHFIKGMAMYADDLPDGVDVRFNTNKPLGTPILGPKDNTVLKPLKDDADNPFGATIKQGFLNSDGLLDGGQREYLDKNGKPQLSVINKVNEEGDWGEWSKTLSSQMLSKQDYSLVHKQLSLSLSEKKSEFDEINSLTNPTVKKKLLISFADDCDASAVHLKAAALPRQASHVILPIRDMKETDIYAPNYNNGEEVVLIRYPHGGTFEIPRLTVNNKQPTAKKLMGNATDAVGINAKVAEKLSGADFDGDTVLVIPVNSNVKIRTHETLKELKDFRTDQYKIDRSDPAQAKLPHLKGQAKQTEMGKVSNLITDMTLKGATLDEIAKATKHSMVVIDAEKHDLNYKQSYVDNDIRALKIKYQGVNEKGQPKGASTLISKAKSVEYVPKRSLYYEIDKDTGEKIYRDAKKQVSFSGKPLQTKSTKMAETNDARTLSSGTAIENAYASYANQLKSLANRARKESITTKDIEYSPSARQTYAFEVDSLASKLNTALKNAPREKQAQIQANVVMRAKKNDNPGMDSDTESKLRNQALATARARLGAKKSRVEISEKEWEAIQAGAVNKTTLNKILENSDLDSVKKLATPRGNGRTLSSAQVSLIKSMSNSGYTTAEIADRVGVSTSTVSKQLKA